MPKPIRLRLSIIQFLQFFALGAILPILPLYLKNYLHFSGIQTGVILSTAAISALVAPFMGSFLADRLISSERLFAAAHISGGIIMLCLYHIQTFPLFFSVYLLYMFILGPTLPLSRTIIFHHVPDRRKHFGGIRVWGTVGWIMVAWFFSFFWLSDFGRGNIPARLPDALLLSALTSFLLGSYTFTLPISGAIYKNISRLFPKESFQIILKKEVLFLALISFLMYLADRFYFYGTSPFLHQIGIKAAFIMPALTMGQFPEILAMSLLGYLLFRMGIKKVLLLGAMFNLLRYTLFTIAPSVPIVILGILCHGGAYTFFYASAFIYLDYKTGQQARAGVHQLFVILTSGAGALFGNLLAGWLADVFQQGTNGHINYQLFWTVPLFITLIVFTITMLFFNRNKGASIQHS